jgi:hypothetical protein
VLSAARNERAALSTALNAPSIPSAFAKRAKAFHALAFPANAKATSSYLLLNIAVSSR